MTLMNDIGIFGNVYDDLDEEDASKQGRNSNKTKPMFKDSNFDVLDDAMKDVDATPVTPPTRTTVFDDDEDLTIAQTLVNMRSEKAKEKGVAFKDVEETPRLIKSITTLQPFLIIDSNARGASTISTSEVRNKARLVAQGYTQEEGIDYDEVFAPVARIEAIRLFFAYASFMGFIVYQMDVKSAFLYGTIEEEVYVCQPPSFEDPQFPDKVYKVEKALYGLHQAPRAWYETLSTYLIENRFRRGTIDKTLFIKNDKGDILLVQVYVDDTIFGSTKKSLCDKFEGLMHKRFQMSSIGELTFFLGSMIRSLMYLTAFRPDITFAVCACARRLISWQCKKLTIVANSTTEVEYVAAANCHGQFVDQHNMVACLEKTEENAEFHQIVDFLSTCLINYALTVSPTIYASYINNFGICPLPKTVNSVKQIHAIVDGKGCGSYQKSSVRSDLPFNKRGCLACNK
ncbi:putative ribonuclease H-like domain-containing protein [Tanacetum coccineum]